MISTLPYPGAGPGSVAFILSIFSGQPPLALLAEYYASPAQDANKHFSWNVTGCGLHYFDVLFWRFSFSINWYLQMQSGSDCKRKHEEEKLDAASPEILSFSAFCWNSWSTLNILIINICPKPQSVVKRNATGRWTTKNSQFQIRMTKCSLKCNE